ncbi:hypothetical protein [Metallibacterium sp.]|uniref:hypothetical protein n=1 Tax=Metallibacterium sp. TaxID=2940281 RepID=UPI0026330D52|nr:hypothetical protein [Metallibacterium sp.]
MASLAGISAWRDSGGAQDLLALSADRYILKETGENPMTRDFVDRCERLAVVAIALAAEAATLLAEEEQGEGSGDNRGKFGSHAVPSFAVAMEQVKRKQVAARRRFTP